MNYSEIMQPAFDLKPNESGIYPVRILDGTYKDIVFHLGKVWFEGEDKLSFEMDVIQGKIDHDDEFNEFVGNYIMYMIMEELREDNERKNENN